jgi:hypothetical protein
MMLTITKLPAILALLLVAAAPLFAGSPKSWLRRKHSGTVSSHGRGGHLVVKHHVAKHPKPHHGNTHF